MAREASYIFYIIEENITKNSEEYSGRICIWGTEIKEREETADFPCKMYSLVLIKICDAKAKTC